MEQLILTPYKSVGDIRFGDDREHVRKINGNYTEFQKNRFSKNTTDDYSLFHVFYTPNNKVEAMEIFKGIELICNDINISSLNLNELIAKLADSNMIRENDSINFPSYGLSVSFNEKEVESYLCYAMGYWD